jgi:hypothetical protein
VNVPARLAGFLAAVVALFGVALVVGSAVGPTNRSAALEREGGHGGDMGGATMLPGVAIATDDLRLVPQTTTFTIGRTGDFRFRIVDADGKTVRDFDVEHDKRMHLIAVRRDFVDYQHLHPVQQSDGSWSVPIRFADPGTYRVFTDFTADGERATLGTDVFVAGDWAPEALPAPTRTVSVDGYDVALRGDGKPGEERELAFTVTRDGAPVAVEPYLGADGHLVSLREGDLAYLHVHPVEEAGSGGSIRFMTEYPSAGRYRLFLQFKHEGRVHTAAFTQEVS